MSMDTQAALAAAHALATAHTVDRAFIMTRAAFTAAGIGPLARRAALDIVMAMPPATEGFFGPATAEITRLNLMRRAQFTVACALRLQQAFGRRRSGQSASAFARQLADERRYYGQQLMAGWGRSQAAAHVDSASMEHGPLLGWYTVDSPTTTADCQAAAGHNFYADRMPPIGYPGMVHPGCRCQPGPPFPGAPLVAGVRPRRSYGKAA